MHNFCHVPAADEAQQQILQKNLLLTGQKDQRLLKTLVFLMLVIDDV